jgi:DNA-binding NarL/FixJ family response regulator
MTDRIRVLIADDNPVVRIGLRSLLDLEPDIDVCGEASSGPEALSLARTESPDVVLLDVRMPGGGGLEVLSSIKELSRVLMLTYTDEPDVVTKALAAGATGYLVHGAFQSSELATAIRDTALGGTRLSPAAASVLLDRLTRGSLPVTEHPANPTSLDERVAAKHGLSRREVDIAELMVKGATNGELAKALFIEEKTVKNHINRLFAKLGADSRPAAIAILLGLRDR